MSHAYMCVNCHTLLMNTQHDKSGDANGGAATGKKHETLLGIDKSKKDDFAGWYQQVFITVYNNISYIIT
jgi:hypothetical protein